jgi:segregation and condensation protein A
VPGSDAASPPRARSGAFEGPLDLLLDEVRRQRVAIADVAMAPLVAAFLAYVRQAAERNIDLDIAWLQTAATLIHWKSLSLLPRVPGLESVDSIKDALVQQLLIHRRAVSRELARKRLLEQARFSRAEVAAGAAPEPSFVTVWDLMQQARDVADWLRRRRDEVPAGGDEFEVERDDVTVEEMCGYLRRQMTGRDRLEGSSLLRGAGSASRQCCLFLGMLEMVRRGELEMTQEEGFGPLWLTVVNIPAVGTVPVVGT